MRVLAALVPLTLAFASAHAAPAVSVGINQAAPVALGAPAATVVAANPGIADVTIIDRRRFIILGRSYGLTNVLALDAAGRTIYNAQVSVGPGGAGQVSLYRGAEHTNYACAGRCERTPMPGEPQSTYNTFAPGYTDYQTRAKPAGEGQSGQ